MYPHSLRGWPRFTQMEACRRVNNACLHRTREEGVAWIGRSGWAGGLVGARLCVPASDSSPQERHRHKRKLTVMVTKAEMTLGSHKTSQLEFSSKQTRELTWCNLHYSRCQNSRALLNLTVKGHIRSVLHCQGPKASLGSFRLQHETPIWPNYPISWSSGQTGRWWRLEHLWRPPLVWGPRGRETRPTSTFSANISQDSIQQEQKELCSEAFEALCRLSYFSRSKFSAEHYPFQLNTSTQALMAVWAVRRRCEQNMTCKEKFMHQLPSYESYLNWRLK